MDTSFLHGIVTNCTFEKLEPTFHKRFKTLKNDEEVYMQLQNIQQQTTKRVEVYYDSLKVTNCLQVKITNVFLTIFFGASLDYLTLD